jgi:hypothetical protein
LTFFSQRNKIPIAIQFVNQFTKAIIIEESSICYSSEIISLSRCCCKTLISDHKTIQEIIEKIVQDLFDNLNFLLPTTKRKFRTAKFNKTLHGSFATKKIIINLLLFLRDHLARFSVDFELPSSLVDC